MKLKLRKLLFNNLIVNKATIAQTNYVANPSFEIIDSCPVFYNSIKLALPWDTLKKGGGAGPDLFAECGAVGLSIPLGFIQGYQYARTGSVFINSDFYAYPQASLYPYYHDYMQSQLLDTLQNGKMYCVTFYVNLTNRSKYAIAEIGAYFDDGSISTCYLCPAVVNPQILSPANVYINDTMNWVKIQGSFIATGNESYMSLGNFKSDATINKILQYPNSSGDVAEYEVDDVSVIESNSKIKADNDTIINKGDTISLGKSIEGMPVDWYDINGNLLAASSTLKVSPTTTTSYVVKMDLCGNVSYDTVKVNVSVGINQLKNQSENISIYPNPTTGNFTLSIPKDNYDYSIAITTTLGQLQYTQIIKNTGIITIQQTLPKGLYFVTLKNNITNETTIKKLIIE